jgi:hypothetical protein
MFNSKSDSDPKPFTAPPQPNGQKGASPRAATSPFAPAATAATGISLIGTDLTILGDKITIISQNKLQDRRARHGQWLHRSGQYYVA